MDVRGFYSLFLLCTCTRKNNYFTFAYDKNCVEGANLRKALMSLKMPLI